MDNGTHVVTLAHARAAIASLTLGDEPRHLRIGDITLHPHQRVAVARIQRTISAHRGALLCDEVGLGKTYVSLAVASRYRSVTVVAPASLSDMWRAAFVATHLSAEFVSIESLGRSGPVPRKRDLLIVDEAHHFRNSCTRRYGTLARLCMLTPVLLLTATPLHNSQNDIAALVALFIGSRAYTMTADGFAPFIVRRDTTTRTATSDSIPVVEHASPTVIAKDPAILDMILALPPPVPPSDGSVATSLIMHGLARQWVSSNAALAGALKRRIARSHGLLASLDAGRYPASGELSAWVYGDDAVQLAFAELLAPATAPLASLASALRAHVAALESILTRTRTSDDDALAQLIRNVVRAHPGEKIVAFSCYAETAEAAYRMMRRDGHTALLTARGAIVASGPVTRAEVLHQFAPGHRRDNIDEHATIGLLIATDLLSEGVNLQEASVVIHLDLPWTAARLEQRIGRIARLGSRHDRVVSYTVNPPERAEQFLRETEIIARKSALSARIFGNAASGATERLEEPTTIQRGERVRAMIDDWHDSESDPHAAPGESCIVAFTRAPRVAAIGVWIVDGAPTLLAWNEDAGVSDDANALDAATILANDGEDAATHSDQHLLLSRVLRSADSWYQQRCAWNALGAPDGKATVPGVHDARRALARVADAASANADFTRRSHSSAVAARLRSAASTPLPLAVEWSLRNFVDSSDDAGMESILELVRDAGAQPDERRDAGFRPAALIVMSPEDV